MESACAYQRPGQLFAKGRSPSEGLDLHQGNEGAGRAYPRRVFRASAHSLPEASRAKHPGAPVPSITAVVPAQADLQPSPPVRVAL